MTINRRKFIKETAFAGGALLASSLIPAFGKTESSVRKITILHTNDMHSRLEPFPMDGGRNQGLGGVAARGQIVKEIRNEVEHVLLLDAGDVFQGTPYFNFFKGEPEIKAMSLMGYDAITIGNHDFDAGLENLSLQLQHSSFPVVISNYNFSNTPMENKYQPYKVFKKGDLTIGLLGIGIELKGLVSENLYGNTVYLDPVESANRTADILKKKYGCDMIICLSHLGDRYDDDKVSDEVLARQSYDIDLIIGGHTHKFFEVPRKYTNQRKGNVIVNQVGWAGIQLGRLDFAFTGSSKKNLVNAHTVTIGKKSGD